MKVGTHLAAILVEYATLLEHPPPRLRAYTKETVIAEKLQAMAAPGEAATKRASRKGARPQRLLAD